MIKNILATIGLIVVGKKSYEFFQHYQGLKAENAQLKADAQRA